MQSCYWLCLMDKEVLRARPVNVCNVFFTFPTSHRRFLLSLSSTTHLFIFPRVALKDLNVACQARAHNSPQLFTLRWMHSSKIESFSVPNILVHRHVQSSKFTNLLVASPESCRKCTGTGRTQRAIWWHTRGKFAVQPAHLKHGWYWHGSERENGSE